LAAHAKSIQEDHRKSTTTPDLKARAATNRTPDFSAVSLHRLDLHQRADAALATPSPFPGFLSSQRYKSSQRTRPTQATARSSVTGYTNAISAAPTAGSLTGRFNQCLVAEQFKKAPHPPFDHFKQTILAQQPQTSHLVRRSPKQAQGPLRTLRLKTSSMIHRHTVDKVAAELRTSPQHSEAVERTALAPNLKPATPFDIGLHTTTRIRNSPRRRKSFFETMSRPATCGLGAGEEAS